MGTFLTAPVSRRRGSLSDLLLWCAGTPSLVSLNMASSSLRATPTVRISISFLHSSYNIILPSSLDRDRRRHTRNRCTYHVSQSLHRRGRVWSLTSRVKDDADYTFHSLNLLFLATSTSLAPPPPSPSALPLTLLSSIAALARGRGISPISMRPGAKDTLLQQTKRRLVDF